MKRCLKCGSLISQRKEFKAKERIILMTPSRYEKVKYCSNPCAASGRMTERYKNGYVSPLALKQGPRPSRETLNKLWNIYKNYRAIARHLGVHGKTIGRWMGRKQDLINPPSHKKK